MFNSKFSKFAMITFFIGLAVLVLLGVSCSGKTSPNVVGKWTPVKGQNVSSFSSFAFSSVTSLEFLKDGTFIAGIMGGSGSGNYSFPDATHIKFQSPTGSNTYTFSLSENTLSLIQPNGDTYKFYRDDSGPGTISTATTLTTFEQLLSTIPDTADTRNQVTINDYAQLRKVFKVNAPKVNCSEDEIWQYFTDLQQANDIRNPDYVHLASPVGIFDNLTYLGNSNEAMQNLGFGYSSIDQESSSGMPPATYHIIKGQFSPDATRQALAVSAKTDPPVTSICDGNTIFSWGGDNQIMVAQPFSPPAYDNLGRGGRFVIQNGYVFKTNLTPEITAILDTQKGKQSSLNDVTEFNLMAKELSLQGVFSTIMTNKTQSVEYVTRMMKTQNQNVVSSNYIANIAKGTKLLPYQSMAVGTGRDDKASFALVILVNADAQTATQNVALLKQRMIDTGSFSGNPWTSYFTSSSITSHDRVLTAKFYGAKGSWWFDWYNRADPLVLCE
jgi:hypothetical protein